jgi:hypothetical protein
MSAELAHPGHVRYVQKWLTHNAEKIAEAVEPPGAVDKTSSGADFVRWLTNIVEQHQRTCDREFARRPPFTQYTGD